MEWAVLCSSCRSRPNPVSRRSFYLTSCGHFVCAECRSESAKPCPQCMAAYTAVKLGHPDQMGKNVLFYFTGPVIALQKMIQAAEFQKAHREWRVLLLRKHWMLTILRYAERRRRELQVYCKKLAENGSRKERRVMALRQQMERTRREMPMDVDPDPNHPHPSTLGPSHRHPSTRPHPASQGQSHPHHSTQGQSHPHPSSFGLPPPHPSTLGPSHPHPSTLGQPHHHPSTLGPSHRHPSTLGPSHRHPSTLGPSHRHPSTLDPSPVVRGRPLPPPPMSVQQRMNGGRALPGKGGGATGWRGGDTPHRMVALAPPGTKLRTPLSVGKERIMQIGPGAVPSCPMRV